MESKLDSSSGERKLGRDGMVPAFWKVTSSLFVLEDEVASGSSEEAELPRMELMPGIPWNNPSVLSLTGSDVSPPSLPLFAAVPEVDPPRPRVRFRTSRLRLL